jgi:(heptosyl)LPS beta-1,4-glucosyltransferase
MRQLSAVIITKNEERNIGRCLESLHGIADDIVVVDSGSTDATRAICESHKVRFFSQDWQGYSATKNYANGLALYDWIFSIDADEAVSPELRDSILKAKETEEAFNYRICRITNYCGRWIRHSSWYPDIKLRFFDRRETRWEGLIHERLNVKDENSYTLLKGDCYHYSYYTIEEHVAQANRFSGLSAQHLYERGKKVSLIKTMIAPGFRFFKMFILRGGLLDGYYGWVIAKISAHAVFLKYVKLRQLHAQR